MAPAHCLAGDPPGIIVKPFGYFLALDCYLCIPGSADDLDLCYNFLEALVERLGMTKQAPPFIFRSPLDYPDKAGLSGWVPLIESGIQIHTLIPKNFITIDIYCCREIPKEPMLELVRATFAPKDIETHELNRGIKYHEE